jgi:hypothetical protein
MQLKVTVKRERALWRAGRKWTGSTVVDSKEFTPAQLKQIKAEALFDVTEVPEPPAEKKPGDPAKK